MKKIHSGVVIDGETFLPGREDELVKVLSREQTARLTDQGAISGFHIRETAEPVETVEPKAKSKTSKK